MPIFADHVTDIADILTSTAENGEIRVSLGDVRTGDGYDSNAAVWGPDGYLARPNEQGDGATRALFVVDGNARRVIATTDRRFSAQAGTMEPGDRMIVTSGPPRIYMKQARAQVGMYTEAETEPASGGKGMIFDMSGADGIVQIRCGGCLIVLDGQKGQIILSATGTTGAATMTLDAVNGISLLAGVVNIDAPFATLGLNSDGTRPGKPGVDTVVVGASGQTAIAAVRTYAPSY